jgi:hypothetical protein
MRLTMANRSKVERARRHHVTGGEGFQHPQQLAPVGLRSARLLAVNLGASFGAKLHKLRVERLAVGADAGIAKASVFGVRFGHILRAA